IDSSASAFDSLVSAPYTVTQPSLQLFVSFFGTFPHGAALHRHSVPTRRSSDLTAALTVNLASSAPTKLAVPGSISVLAGLTQVAFPASRVSPTVPLSPAMLTATATGLASSTLDVDVVTPTFRFVDSDCCFQLLT